MTKTQNVDGSEFDNRKQRMRERFKNYDDTFSKKIQSAKHSEKFKNTKLPPPLFVLHLRVRMFYTVMLMHDAPDSGAYAILAHYLLHALSGFQHGSCYKSATVDSMLWDYKNNICMHPKNKPMGFGTKAQFFLFALFKHGVHAFTHSIIETNDMWGSLLSPKPTIPPWRGLVAEQCPRNVQRIKIEKLPLKKTLCMPWA